MRTDREWFKDEFGRTLLLRGVNLAGSSKVPTSPNGASYNLNGFFNHRDVSFVGRPFPLAEADEHFSRLRAWGLTFLRFLVTWEAIEHAGPGIYDEAYLDYLRAILIKAREYGVQVFIDPHQDVWCRLSGGDGAPGWTLEAAGLNPRAFAETGAAIVHATYGDPFPRMVWPSNYTKLAAATMFTLFFGGNDFAPQTKVNGEPIQDYLQNHYIAAVSHLAERVRDLDNVVGYDTFNEPMPGFIGWKDLRKREGLLQTGLSPTPYQAMLLGDGYSLEIEELKRGVFKIRQVGSVLVNSGGVRAWLENHACVWRENGVWEVDSNGSPVLLRPDYFAIRAGHPVNFTMDYFLPFAHRYERAIQAAHPGAIVFVEGTTTGEQPTWEKNDSISIAFAPHWYDAYVLYFKSFLPWIAADVRGKGKVVFGRGNIRRSFSAQIGDLKNHARNNMGNIPTLMAEFGIAFDLGGRRAFTTGDFNGQVKALDRSLRAMEDNLVNYTIWNYTPDNTNLRGDHWNDEDLSIFSRDQQKDPHDLYSGGRALRALLRPYPQKTAGEPLRLTFDYINRSMEYHFRHDPSVDQPTEFYIPEYQYPQGYQVKVSDGRFEPQPEKQRLLYWHSLSQPDHTVKIEPA